MDIKQVPVDDLFPYIMNSRTHSEAQINQIAASIREFGFTNPILTDGDNGVIAGHGRLAAAQKLKLKTVPVIELSHLTEIQKKAYVIADNKIALNAGWDEEILVQELKALQAEEYDLETLAFSAEELNMLFDGWQSDIDLPEKHGEHLDGIFATIKIKITEDQKVFAEETITNALDSAGIDYDFG